MEKVRPWCGQPSDRGRLRNRTEQNMCYFVISRPIIAHIKPSFSGPDLASGRPGAQLNCGSLDGRL